jgi:hypothetical protein
MQTSAPSHSGYSSQETAGGDTVSAQGLQRWASMPRGEVERGRAAKEAVERYSKKVEKVEKADKHHEKMSAVNKKRQGKKPARMLK